MKMLIISDIHGNFAALQSIAEAADDVERVLFLGDVVDYGPQPRECIEWLRENSWLNLRGNHDNAVFEHVDCKCGQAFHKYSVATREYTKKILQDTDFEFISPIKPSGRFELDGKKVFIAHGAPSDPLFKYVKPSMRDGELANEVQGIEADIVLLGHTHLQMDRTVTGIRVVNPGSAGQSRDGDPRVGYALWQDGEITLHRVAYDFEKTCCELDGSDIEPDIIERMKQVLRTGV